jgi:hypothetical protein
MEFVLLIDQDSFAGNGQPFVQGIRPGKYYTAQPQGGIMRKICGVFAAGLFVFIVLFSFSTAKAGDWYETKVAVKNNYSKKMWVFFKCYDETSWEDNSCLYFNTGNSEPIKTGDRKEFSKTMKNTKAKCNKISIQYGRSDRSCGASECQKNGDFTFKERMPMILEIIDQGGDFVMIKGY